MLLVSSCIFSKGTITVNAPNRTDGTVVSAASVTKVEIINHQLIVTGKNLDKIQNVKIEGTALNETFAIESQSTSQIIANSLNLVSIGVGGLFNLILSDATAASTFPIDFALCNATLNGKGFDCSITANTNDVLTYDGSKWVPKALNLSGLIYVGALSALPGNYPSSPAIGEYWIINQAGTISGVNYAIGDWLVYNDSGTWDKINNATVVTSVHGRTVAVVAAKNDYNIGQMSDVDMTTTPPVNGKILQFNGTNWVPVSPTVGNVGIGTTAPGNKLAVTEPVATAAAIPAVGSNGGTFSVLSDAGKYGLIIGAKGNGDVFQQSQRVDGSAFVYNLLLQPSGGNVGIGTTTPSEKLDVSGNIRASGQLSTGAQTLTGGTSTVDWNTGNAISTDYNCASSVTMNNLRNGGTYTLVVTDTGTTQCTFGTSTTGTDAATVTYRFKPANAARTTTSHTVYTLMRVGTVVYVSWASGF